jgi:hypothetical protein
MQKTLQEIQAENRRLILEAVHGCSYEEALKKELGFRCALINKRNDNSVIIERVFCEVSFSISDGSFGLRADDVENYYKIVGKPITLSRALLALNGLHWGLDVFDTDLTKLRIYDDPNNDDGFDWDLTKETLEDQSEETQRAINQLLTQ